MKPGKTGIPRIVDATRHSINGIRACWANEAAFRQNSMLAVLAFCLSFFVAQSVEQWLLLNLPTWLLLTVELLNTAVENVVDRVGHDHNVLSGRAKDMGSAAVFCCLVMTGVVWAAILWNNYLR